MKKFLLLAVICLFTAQINSCSSDSPEQPTPELTLNQSSSSLDDVDGQSSSGDAGDIAEQSSSSDTGDIAEQSSSSGEGDIGEQSSSSGAEIGDSSSSGEEGVSSSGEADVSSSSTALSSSSSTGFGGLSSGGTSSDDVFVDPRDGNQYEYSVVSDKIWMRGNLNYSRNNTLGYCYGVDINGANANRDSTSCGDGYGRIYKWSIAMDGMSAAGSQGLCPAGWHIPTAQEWNNPNAKNNVPVIYAGNYNANSEYPPLGWKARGVEGLYWTSTNNNYFVFTNNTDTHYKLNDNAGAADYFSVRCVANDTWDCGSETYNPVTKFCSGNNVYVRCDKDTYNVATHFCADNTLYEKCGGEEYEPLTQDCQGTTIFPKCGSTIYNPAAEFCSRNKIFDLCGGEEYEPIDEKCEGNRIVEKPVLFKEDFECEGLCGWSFENIVAPNASGWNIGPATSYEGSKSAYVANNAGENAYIITAQSSANIFRSITFPTQTEDFTLQFYWKGMGEVNYDYMLVFLVSSSGTITSEAPASYHQVGSKYYGRSTWTLETINLPAETYSGKTYNLLFRWQNNASAGNNPPAAIDNILIK